MIIRGAPLLHMLNSYRIVWGMGGYGSGKTLNAFDVAYSLYETGRYRYILGNCNSVWTDSPENVVLRDGAFVDAIVILDEGGLFMRLSRDADAFLLGLRKLNITIIVPSVLPPSQRIKVLQIQRVFNAQIVGLPLWIYEYRLGIGSIKDKETYAIWKPSEMWGIYDTLDYPVDDCYLSDWFDYWMRTAKTCRPAWVTWGPPPGYESESPEGDTRTKRKNRRMDTAGWDAEEILEATEGLSESLSSFTNGGSGARGRRRG